MILGAVLFYRAIANYDTWIDAEGKLKSPDDNGKKLFDTTLAEKYIVRAIAWQMKYGDQK